jgi:Yip1 domain
MSEAGMPDTASTKPAHGRSFVERLLGILRLDGAAYDDVAADPGAMGQAAAVVIAAAILRAVSAEGGPISRQGLLFLAQIALLWPVNSLMVFVIGRWFGHTPDLGRVARVLGFAMAPFALAAFGVVPVEAVRIAAAFLSTALVIATFVVGVRHALQTTTGRAAFVSIVIALVLVFVSMVYNFMTAPR